MSGKFGFSLLNYEPRFTILAVFLSASLLTVAFIPVVRRMAIRLGVVDQGGGRRIHAGVVPRLGGVGIFLSCLLAVFFSSVLPISTQLSSTMLVGLFAAGAIVFLTGVLDDVKGMKVYTKLILEILAACVMYYSGFKADFISFNQYFNTNTLSLFFTILWVLVVTNAINLIDGMDGLAAGTGIFITFTMVLVTSDPLSIVVALALMGALAGFLFFNYPPAKIFMGDSGSLFLGFMLAALSIKTSNKSTMMLGIMVPITIFAFPLMDMLCAVIRRYYRGLPLGEADREHIHHKLLEKGFSKKTAVLFLYSVNFLLMIAVLIITRNNNIPSYSYFLVILALVIGGVRYLGYLRFRPFLKSLVDEYLFMRKRKYYLYLLRVLQKDVQKGHVKGIDDFWRRVTLMLDSMEFTSAKMRLSSKYSIKTEFMWENQTTILAHQLFLRLPLVFENEACGEMYLKRASHENIPMPCVSEFTRVMSTVIPSVIVKSTKCAERVGKEAEASTVKKCFKVLAPD